MKYRVRLDLPFDKEVDAQALMTYAKNLSSKADSINEGKNNEEIAFIDLEKCYHDETPSKGCEKIEKVEIKKLSAVSL